MSIPERIIKYQNKLDWYTLLIQLPTLVILPVVFGFLGVWYSAALTLLIVCYVNGGFLIWKRKCMPEMILHRWLYYVFVFPHFIWTAFCLIFFIPALFFEGWLLLYLFSVIDEIPSLFYTSLAVVSLFCLLLSFYSCVISPKWVRKNHVILNFENLPEKFKNYKIVQLSDLHVGNFTSYKTLRRLRKKVEKLSPDLIVITGDILTFGDNFIESTVNELKEYTKICRVIMCSGNHEYFVDYQKLRALLNESSIQLLHNNHTPIIKDNEAIYIAGIIGVVDKLDQQIQCINQSLIDVPNEGFKILLSHEGTVFDYSADRGVDLILSGHTHGGQIAFPFLPKINFSSFRYPYNSGLYTKGNKYLYVSRGIGCVHFYIRLFCPPEITVLELDKIAPSNTEGGVI